MNFQTSAYIYNKLGLIESQDNKFNFEKLWSKITTDNIELKYELAKFNTFLGDKGDDILNGNICKHYDLKYCSNYYNSYLSSFNLMHQLNYTKGMQIPKLDFQFDLSYYMLSSSKNFNYTYNDYLNIDYFSDKKLFTKNDLLRIDSSFARYIGFNLRNFQLYGLSYLVQQAILNNKNIILKFNQTSFLAQNMNTLIFNYENRIQSELLLIINSVFILFKEDILNKFIEDNSYFWDLLIIVTVVWIFIYSILIYIMLDQVLKKINKQETLSKRLLGEIPDSVLQSNSNIAKEINSLLNNDKKGFSA